MKNLVTEIAILSFGIPVIAEFEKGKELTADQLAWLEELAMKEYLALPLEERIQKMENIQTADAWSQKEALEKVTEIEEECLTYREIMEDLYECQGAENEENGQNIEELDLVEDDCG